MKLSKSRFVAGCQCLRRLYWQVHEPELAARADDAAEAIIQQGQEVGMLARTLFPGGVEVDCSRGLADAIRTTRELVAHPEVRAIFEAVFEHENVLVKVDILHRRRDGRWRLIEVKSTADLKNHHLEDVAVQYRVVSDSGLDLASACLAHVNRAYVRDGFHINADIADAVSRYLDATQDAKFETEVGLELLVETARLWRSLGQHDAMGHFRIEGVTGPDEYSAIKDNNVYTNLMAQRNLACAAAAVAQLPTEAAALGVSTEEAASWRDASNAMYIPFDERLGVHPQHEGFTDYARWDFKNTPEEDYPLLLHFPYFQLYRKQVVKQADLVLAMYLRSEAFTAEQKAANFAYYEPLTVRDSSLSACTQAVMAAEVGQLDLAHDYLAEAALMDLRDVEHNTSDGVHMASLAGAWMALVAGFGGMRAGNGPLAFSPRLPDGISRLMFRLRYRGRKLSVEIQGQRARYTLMDGDPLPITHHGDEFQLGHRTVERKIPPVKAGPRPEQPFGRPPYSRSSGI